MAYIGNVPAEKYTALTQQTFSTPTGTSFTLSQAVTNAVDIDLYIDNVKQDPTTYSVSGTALTTSTIASPSTMYCIFNGRTTETVNPPDGSVGTAKVTDDAITLAKLAPGTDGNIISFDASGNPVAVATGSDGQVLTSTGAGSAPAFEAAFAGFPIGAGAYLTGGQAISNNSVSILIFNTESYDPNSDYNVSNGTYTVPSGQAGKYLITGHISIPTVANTLLGFGIRVNGTSIIFKGVSHSYTDTGGNNSIIIADLAVADAVTWFCHHKAGSTKTTEASAYGTGMSIQRIA